MPNSDKYEMHREYYADAANMHSTSMAIRRYSRLSDQYEQSDFHVIQGCIKVALAMQVHVGICQDQPYVLVVQKLTRNPLETIGGELLMFFLTIKQVLIKM